MNQIKRDKIGYSILVLDKYILCGTVKDSYFKPLDNLGISNPRQYKSLKVLLDNIHSRLNDVFPELDKELLNNNYVTKSRWSQELVPDYSPDAIKYLIKQGFIKIVKISQILTLEEVLF